MEKNLINLLKLPDLAFSRLYLKFFHEKNSLIIVGFHNLFRNNKEITLNHVDPQQRMTTDKFRQIVEYWLNHDYTSISPNDILNGLNTDKKYIMITFDDGYYNNQHALPTLKKYQIPATFFISTNHVKYNKCFWWDVLYREQIKLGVSVKDISQEQKKLKSKTNEEIEKYLKDIFGEESFNPISDIDRPFTPSELKDFSKEELVFLGNHTSDHAILTNYSSNEIKSQILSSQNTIKDITGTTPITIAYPDGSYSNEIIRISKEIGCKLGITVDYKKNYLPIDYRGDDCMRLGRFLLEGSDKVIKQCELLRSDIVVSRRISNFLRRRY
jgi:peptidoglycan/xylan/chitin deacetylase (PgdA/CDA1 family)